MYDDGSRPALEDMTPEQMRQELEEHRNLWDWLPENVRRQYTHVGSLSRLVLRNFHAVLGIWLPPDMEVTQYRLHVEDSSHDYDRNVDVLEEKVIQVPVSNVVQQDWIQTRDEVAREAGVVEQPAESSFLDPL